MLTFAELKRNRQVHPGHPAPAVDSPHVQASGPHQDLVRNNLRGPRVQAKLEADRVPAGVQRQLAEEEPEDAGTARSRTASAGLAAARNALQGGGEPMPETLRRFFEPRFQFDFGQVRVHADANAARSARALDAQAFTIGPHVVFGEARYAPESESGRRLIAHELAHVIQQDGRAAGRSRRIRAGSHVPASPHAASSVQRKLSELPTKLVISEVEDVGFPKDGGAKLDQTIRSRQAQDYPEGPGKYIGSVTYKNLPATEKTPQGAEANLERRAVKHALLEAIITDIQKKAGIEMRVRVPLDDSPAAREYAMVVLRFDRTRNVEVEYAGKDVQASRATGDPSPILARLETAYGVKFVTDGITAKLPGEAKPSKCPGKAWSPNDAALLNDALPLVGSTEKGILQGAKIRRLAAKSVAGAAGFYSTGDRSINLTDAALPFEKALWFGGGCKFYTRGVHTVLHEIGHALHFAAAPAGSPKGAKRIALFKTAVLEESGKRTGKAPGTTFPPPGIVVPTEYAAKSWGEFFADTYSIYITNPSFLTTPEFGYLSAFFKKQFP